MPKKMPAKSAFSKTEHVSAGILVSLLGVLWLMSETGVIATTLPVGPLALVISGLALAAPYLRE